MIFLQTAFDRSRKFRPLASMSFDDATGEIQFYALYLPDPNTTLAVVEERKKQIIDLFSDDVTLNDFKAHIQGFNLPLNADYNVWSNPEDETPYPKDPAAIKKILLTKLIAARKEPARQKWMSLVAQASLVYQDLENRGVLFEGMEAWPLYEQNVFSGRSKTSSFNVQGMTPEADVMPMVQQDYFINADWIAADMRSAALMSNDEYMLQSFHDSDPYEYLAKAIGGETTRSQCKDILFQSVFSLDTSSPALDVYPKFKNFIENSAQVMQQQGFLTSMLGRSFSVAKAEAIGKTNKAVFSAIVQGTTAHAMQNSLARIHKLFPGAILTEVHDSIILCCRREMIRPMCDRIGEIMLHPFKGILPSNPSYPLKVTIGSRWGQWNKILKEFRDDKVAEHSGAGVVA